MYRVLCLWEQVNVSLSANVQCEIGQGCFFFLENLEKQLETTALTARLDEIRYLISWLGKDKRGCFKNFKGFGFINLLAKWNERKQRNKATWLVIHLHFHLFVALTHSSVFSLLELQTETSSW